MALTPTLVKDAVFGNMRVKIVDELFDSSYPTGGESLTANDLGMTTLYFVIPASADGYTFEYDHTNSKLMAYNTTKAHAHNFKVYSNGSTVTGTKKIGFNVTSTAGKLVRNGVTFTLSTNSPVQDSTVTTGSEVANGTSLSSVTCRVIAFGA